MKATKLLYFSAIVFFGLAGTMAHAAQGNSQGHGKGHDKDNRSEGDQDRDDRDDHGHRQYAYSKHDRDQVQDWYEHHRGNLPPGLAKKDRLPPGLEKKMVVHEVIPAEYRVYVHPAPVEIVRVLPPPPPDCEHVVVGGRIVLMNRKTSVVLDVFNVSF